MKTLCTYKINKGRYFSSTAYLRFPSPFMICKAILILSSSQLSINLKRLSFYWFVAAIYEYLLQKKATNTHRVFVDFNSNDNLSNRFFFLNKLLLAITCATFLDPFIINTYWVYFIPSLTFLTIKKKEVIPQFGIYLFLKFDMFFDLCHFVNYKTIPYP